MLVALSHRHAGGVAPGSAGPGRAGHLLDALEVVGRAGAVLLEEPGPARPVLAQGALAEGGAGGGPGTARAGPGAGLVGAVQAELAAQEAAAATGSACGDTALNVQGFDARAAERATAVQPDFIRRLERALRACICACRARGFLCVGAQCRVCSCGGGGGGGGRSDDDVEKRKRCGSRFSMACLFH